MNTSLSPREFNRLTREEKIKWLGDKINNLPPQQVHVIEHNGIIICLTTDKDGKPGPTINATTRKERDNVKQQYWN